MNKILYPGSFDPITFGHINIIKRAARQCEELTILISESTGKSYMFSKEERISLIQESLSELDNVKVKSFSGLTVDYAAANNISVLLRGVRMASDFEYEMTLHQTNKKLNNQIETFTIFADPEYLFISSTFIKDIAKNKGPLEEFVPKVVQEALIKKFN